MNRVITDTTNLNRLLSSIDPDTEKAIKTIAFQVEALAKIKAPVDTGALRSSIYVSLKSSNTPPTSSEESLPTPKDNLTAYIGPSVEYAIYQELGTRSMDPQPFLVPALREVERQLEDYFRSLFR